MEPTLTTLLDSLQRTIIGIENTSLSTDKTLAITNPAVIHIMPDERTGQIRLQILPLFFKEFQADKEADTIVHYNRNIISLYAPIVYDFKVAAQYKQMFNPSAIITPKQTGNDTPIIKLFDDNN